MVRSDRGASERLIPLLCWPRSTRSNRSHVNLAQELLPWEEHLITLSFPRAPFKPTSINPLQTALLQILTFCAEKSRNVPPLASSSVRYSRLVFLSSIWEGVTTDVSQEGNNLSHQVCISYMSSPNTIIITIPISILSTAQSRVFRNPSDILTDPDLPSASQRAFRPFTAPARSIPTTNTNDDHHPSHGSSSPARPRPPAFVGRPHVLRRGRTGSGRPGREEKQLARECGCGTGIFGAGEGWIEGGGGKGRGGGRVGRQRRVS
jgi:hypothetical protein